MFVLRGEVDNSFASITGLSGLLMNGLRVYIRTESRGITGHKVFYSRRGDGPIYSWRYEAGVDHWRVVRMHAADIPSRELSVASWKSVPEKLQAQLGEHYQD